MKKSIQLTLVLLLAAVLVLGLSAAAWAHACVVEELGGAYLQFSYSDGTAMNGAKVIIQDAGGATLGTDKTSREGVYSYEEFAGQAAKVVVNDGEGHVVEYEVPAEMPPVTDATPAAEAGDAADTAVDATGGAGSGMNGVAIAGIAAVVAAAVIIALLFAKRGKKK
ncbi:MAG: hypothetical protein K6B40_07565 [Firmicutes bacterium]|nr:hypothetical protein [Bacillota bacterium]